MREHVKVEVAMEILSMCMSIAISNNDNEMIEEISKLRNRIFEGDMKSIDETIKKYGEKVKKVLGDSNE